MTSKLKINELSYNDSELVVLWSSNTETRINLVKLRKLCPCAGCRGGDFGPLGAMTGHITEAKIQAVQFVGNYAVNISWDDLHNTGIYSFQTLLEYGQE